MREMPDLKKIITGFLILAAGASSSALILSNIGSQPSTNNAAQNANQVAAATSSPILSGNAFYPSQDIATNPDESEAATSTDDPNNLTDGMADALANSIVAANPNGIQTDANGNPQVATPDNQTIAAALQNEPAFQNVTVPDWDAEAAALQGQIKIVPFTLAGVTTYITNFDDIVNKQIVKTGLSAMANAGSMPTDEPAVIASGASAASNMLAAALTVPTPTPLVDFQKSFIKLLVYQRDEAQLVQEDSQDPEMTASILQAKSDDYQQAIQDFNDQGNKLKSAFSTGENTAGPQGGLLSFLDSFFSVHKAQAQGLPVIAPLTNFLESLGIAQDTASKWAVYLAGVAKDMALQIGKNLIMALIQKKVLAYIQNSGAPRFVTNWGTEAVQAGEMSAVNAINQNFACISKSGPFSGVQVVLNAIYKPGNSVCASTFGSNVAGGITPQQFYNDFSNGGFVAFGQTLQPSNNFYGGLFFAAQAAGQASQQGTSLFNLKTNSAQGYRSSQVCDDGSNPNGTGMTCVNGAGQDYYPNKGGECNPGDFSIPEPNDGTCSDGTEPTLTMPGIVNKDTLDKALGGSPLLVSAANSLAGLVQFAANDLLMGLVNQGIQSASQAVNGALQGDGGITGFASSSITAANTSTYPTAAESTELFCGPSVENLQISPTQPSTPAAFTAGGGTYDLNANPPNYFWSSTGPDGTITGTGSIFNLTYTMVGTDTVTLSDSVANDTPATCVASVTLESTSTLVTTATSTSATQ
jgi:hypothetical protein